MRSIALVLTCLLLAACGGPVPLGEVTPAPARQATAIEGRALDAAAFPVLYDALTAQRPAMLRTRSANERLAVVIDGVEVGGIDVLRTIRTADVAHVERMSGVRQRSGAPVLRVTLR